MAEISVRLKKKLNEVFYVEPNDLGIGFLTYRFRKVSAYFKTIPFIYIIPFAFLISFVMYILFGKLFIRLVTILQYGF